MSIDSAAAGPETLLSLSKGVFPLLGFDLSLAVIFAEPRGPSNWELRSPRQPRPTSPWLAGCTG